MEVDTAKTPTSEDVASMDIRIELPKAAQIKNEFDAKIQALRERFDAVETERITVTEKLIRLRQDLSIAVDNARNSYYFNLKAGSGSYYTPFVSMAELAEKDPAVKHLSAEAAKAEQAVITVSIEQMRMRNEEGLLCRTYKARIDAAVNEFKEYSERYKTLSALEDRVETLLTRMASMKVTISGTEGGASSSST